MKKKEESINPVLPVNTVPPSAKDSAMAEVFDKRGGFRRLRSFTLATIVQIVTWPLKTI